MPSPLIVADAYGREVGSTYNGYAQGGGATIGGTAPWVWMGGLELARDEAPAPRPLDLGLMIERDGKALQVLEALTQPIRGASGKTVGGDGQMAAWTDSWIKRLDPPWEVVVGQISGACLYDRALFEVVWGVGPDGRLCPVRIAFRPTHNTALGLDDNGQPVNIKQSISGRDVVIPASVTAGDVTVSRAFYYLHNQHRAPGVGIGDMRPAWVSHWEKKAIRALWRIFLNRAAMPWTIASATQATDPKQIAQLAQRVASVRSGGVVGVGLGEDAKTLDAGGTAGQVFLSALQWADQQMTQSTLTQWLDLGQAKVGSFALSKSHSDTFTLGRQAMLTAMQADFTRQLVVVAAKANWPDAQDYPAYVFDALDQGDSAQLATLLGQIAAAPVVNPTIPQAFIRGLVLANAKNLGLDVPAITEAIDSIADPTQKMHATLAAGAQVLAAAIPQAA